MCDNLHLSHQSLVIYRVSSVNLSIKLHNIMPGFFDLNKKDLIKYVMKLPDGQGSITEEEAKDIRREIRSKDIKGADFQNMDQNTIQNKLSGIPVRLVQRFYARVEETIQQEAGGIAGGPGQNALTPQTFNIQIMVGTRMKPFTVNKSWTQRQFKEKVYEKEKGHLPTNAAERKRVVDQFNLTGTDSRDDDKTIEQLGWSEATTMSEIPPNIGGRIALMVLKFIGFKIGE
eukprot:219925_1